MRPDFSEDELATIRTALDVAAERYRQNAAELRTIPGHDRLAEQFDRQATEAAALIGRIDE